jgi:hypothetical protein
VDGTVQPRPEQGEESGADGGVQTVGPGVTDQRAPEGAEQGEEVPAEEDRQSGHQEAGAGSRTVRAADGHRGGLVDHQLGHGKTWYAPHL